jgi:DNA-binding IclR family transcriptional regulator
MLVAGGVIEAFGREERTPSDVAAATGNHAGTVARIIRALESRGVFEQIAGGRYRLTAAGRLFLRDEPASLAGLASFKGWEL